MYKTTANKIDEGDVVAYIDDLDFVFTTVEDIDEELASTIDWATVTKAQISGSIVILETKTNERGFVDKVRCADHAKFLVLDS